MLFQPSILNPTPDPFFVKELKKIDPSLRVGWAFERYLLDRWVIERKISPERYYRMYRALFESGEDRFVTQPIYDTSQPLYDAYGEPTGKYRQVGERKFDLAPEYEWVMFVENSDQSFRPLDSRTLMELKRAYAWDRFHSFTRQRIEREAEEAKKEASMDSRINDLMKEKLKDVYRELGIRVQI